MYINCEVLIQFAKYDERIMIKENIITFMSLLVILAEIKTMCTKI